MAYEEGKGKNSETARPKLGNWGGRKQKQVAHRRIVNGFSSWLRKTEAGKREEMAEVAEVFSVNTSPHV